MTLASLAEQSRALAPGMLDVRGWEVRTLVDDVAVGTAHDLLLDEIGRVRWLDLALADGPHALLPAGQGRADRRQRRIWLPGLSAERVAWLPPHSGDASVIDGAGERALLAAYAAVLLGERPDAAAAASLVDAPPADDPRLDARGLFPWAEE
ncbi:MAG TPA: hypothetical protein VF832_07810 [Longimicrobiales bacterium]